MHQVDQIAGPARHIEVYGIAVADLEMTEGVKAGLPTHRAGGDIRDIAIDRNSGRRARKLHQSIAHQVRAAGGNDSVRIRPDRGHAHTDQNGRRQSGRLKHLLGLFTKGRTRGGAFDQHGGPHCHD